MIRHCDCHSSFQDKLYGPGMRVMNPCRGNTAKLDHVKCTVCSNKYPNYISSSKEKEKKKK